MSLHQTGVLLVASKTLTLVFGCLLTAFAVRAFRRTGSKALRALAIGIGLLTLGDLLGGLVHQLIAVDLVVGVVIQSSFTAIGFAIILYSLFTDDARPTGDVVFRHSNE
ncbi:hypothetical protein ACKVMT_02975 [Halobacteriales archaeon Cl-PHB]